MLKPQQLRKTLTDSVPLLQRNPDSLNVFIDSGRIVSTLATSLSFEYQYRLNMVITDYTGNIDLLIVPLLEWLRVNEPDIMATKEKQQNGFTFKADVISDTASDISIDLQLTERVIIRRVGDELHVEHVGENPLAENDARPLQLFTHGQLISEWQS
ncbi:MULTISPECIES: phage tail protein [Pantoea]|uniref:Tail fiber protein n=2 Tax=Pantoea TaxID=53335 RepID=A0A0U3U9Q4_9GAMM|nr:MULTISPECIES: phage tail protein [Pantoea]ALV92015.1 tail fiber protein [Pantoea vagans]KHJ65996.1 tail fiber protein [Pantoea rodasii]